MGGSLPCTRTPAFDIECIVIEQSLGSNSSRSSIIRQEGEISEARGSIQNCNVKASPKVKRTKPMAKPLRFSTEDHRNTLEVKNNKEIKLPHGTKYQGQVKNNQFHGIGTITLPSGKTYRGQWAHGKMHGKGVYQWPDGRFYKGEFVQNKKHGTGVYGWGNGKIYTGGFVNGLQHGEGEIMFYRGNKPVKRKGQWVKGKRVSWLD